MDDLARIESCYGSIAEYNRCMEERDVCSGYQPTYEELVADGDYDEIPFPRTEPLLKEINIGDEIRNYEFDGGYTDYKIIKFNKNRTRVYVTETWYNFDGCGKRKPHWCNFKTDELGDKFQPEDSYDSWVRKESY